MTEIDTAVETYTLSQRLAEGRIPVADALRYAMILAESLRRMHEEGRAHGAFAPANVSITDGGLELLPSRLTPTASAYAAPEVLEGKAADARSDIYSFGAVLYEMLTGQMPFQGRERTGLPSTGSPAVDRLLAVCMAPDPGARAQRMQKVMLDLKLLAAAAARSAAPVALARDTAAAEALRAEMIHVEARLNARMQSQERKFAELYQMAAEALTPSAPAGEDVHAAMLQMETRMAGRAQAIEKKVAEIQKAAAEALYREPAEPGASVSDIQQAEARLLARMQSNQQAATEMHAATGETVAALREELAASVSQLAAAEERAARAERAVEALAERLAHMENRLAESMEHTHGGDGDRIHALEEAVETVRRQGEELHELVAQDMLGFESRLKAQSSALESARTAMAQTDDLVERVVEALESLQSTVLDSAESRDSSVN